MNICGSPTAVWLPSPRIRRQAALCSILLSRTLCPLPRLPSCRCLRVAASPRRARAVHAAAAAAVVLVVNYSECRSVTIFFNMPAQKTVDAARAACTNLTTSKSWDYSLWRYNQQSDIYVSLYGNRVVICGFVVDGVLLCRDFNYNYSVMYDGESYYVEGDIEIHDNLMRRISGSLSVQIPDMRYDYERNLWTIGDSVIQGQCIYDRGRRTYVFFSRDDGRAIIRHV